MMKFLRLAVLLALVGVPALGQTVAPSPWLVSTQPANAWSQLIAPLNGTTYIDNVATMENDSVKADGTCGNAATRYRDSIIHYERGAIGYSSILTGCTGGFNPDHLFAEIGNIGPAADPDDTSWAIVNTHAVGATNFPNTQYIMEEMRGDTGNIYWNKATSGTHGLYFVGTSGKIGIGTGSTAPVNLLDVAGGMVVGASFAGSLTAPTDGLAVKGILATGNFSTIPSSEQLYVAGNAYIDPDIVASQAGRATFGVIRANGSKGAIRYTEDGVGAVAMGYWSTAGVFGTDGGELDLRTGMNANDPSTGTTRASISSSGLNVPSLTASLPICTDASKNLTSTCPAGDQPTLIGTTSAIGGGALTPGACTAGTATVTGATSSMVATASPSADPDSVLSTGIAIYSFVSSSNTVTVRVCAIVAVTPASVTYNVRVIQ